MSLLQPVVEPADSSEKKENENCCSPALLFFDFLLRLALQHGPHDSADTELVILPAVLIATPAPTCLR